MQPLGPQHRPHPHFPSIAATSAGLWLRSTSPSSSLEARAWTARSGKTLGPLWEGGMVGWGRGGSPQRGWDPALSFGAAGLCLDPHPPSRGRLQALVLSGETQERERILYQFSKRFHYCNPGLFSSVGREGPAL